MSVLEDTGRGYPLPHPDNNPRSVDVPRLRQALELIDEDMTALASSLDGKADASGVTAEISAAISALLAGAPEAYDTLVEIADKLASDDDVIAGILTSIAAKANIVDVFTRNEMEGALDAKAPLNSPVFVNKVTLPNGRVIDETSLPFEALVRVQRSANTQLVRLDGGRMFDITSGTFTQTFAAAAVLGDGWWCYIRNSGTGDITIPASDGRTNWIMYPGEVRLFQCDGTVLRSIVIAPFNKTFTASGNFIKPPGYSLFKALVWSGGSSGQRSGGGSSAAGGGAGGFFPFDIVEGLLGNSEAVVVGAGGAAKISSGETPNPGGASSLGGKFVVNGSSGFGLNGGGVEFGGQSSGFSGAPQGTFGSSSTYGGGAPSNDAAQNSGSSVFGGGAGGSINASGVIRSPGTSQYGGNGGAASDTGNGSDGQAPAGGGGATRTGTRSGAGARGEVRIYGVV